MGHPAADRAAGDRRAHDGRHGDGVRARRRGARRRLVHRRRRLVARRVARGDQPVRRAPAAGDLLRAEQPDGALDAGRAISRPSASSPTRRSATASPAITIDGTDPDAIAAAFAWAAERARAGDGPDAHRAGRACACAATRITTTCCTSARIRSRRGTIRRSTEQGYADRELYAYWAARDPIATYAARLEAEGVIEAGDLERIKREAEALVERAGARGHRRALARAGDGRRSACSRTSRRACAIEVLDPAVRDTRPRSHPALPPRRSRRRRSIRRASTFLEAVMLGVGDALRADPRVFVFGEDVGGSVRQRVPAAAGRC